MARASEFSMEWWWGLLCTSNQPLSKSRLDLVTSQKCAIISFFLKRRKYFVSFFFQNLIQINMDGSDDKMSPSMFYYRKRCHDIETTLLKSEWTILASCCSSQNLVDRTAMYIYLNASENRKGKSIMDSPEKLAT